YLNSPFTARLLGEILTELVEQGMAERASLTVCVKKLDYNSRHLILTGASGSQFIKISRLLIMSDQLQMTDGMHIIVEALKQN
ncbi:hypothetical protein MMS56_29100, partial [Escherichia coli]|nr:hypothetical protein [Escherichia coli]